VSPSNLAACWPDPAVPAQADILLIPIAIRPDGQAARTYRVMVVPPFAKFTVSLQRSELASSARPSGATAHEDIR